MKVLIVGGGVTGIEALLALHDLAPDEVDVTLVAPTPDFIYKPLAVQEPFGSEPAARIELAPLVEQNGGTFIQRAVSRIDPEAQRVELDDGSSVDFDAAIVCVGARAEPAFAHAETLDPSGKWIEIDSLLRQAAGDESGRIAFVVPPGGSWPLPAYELALMAQARARELGVQVTITVVTPEASPLAIFGPHASEAVASVLAARGIEVRAGARAEESAEGELVLRPQGDSIAAGAVVALPALRGPRVNGLPADENGFLPIDEHARVRGTSGVYAAGDGTNFPVKHGGIGTQQADAAAEHIAAEAGASVEPQPFHPVLRGKLITGDESLNLKADIGGGCGEGVSSLDYLWWPPQKIAGRYISAMLAGDEPHAVGPPPEHGIDVEVSLDREWHAEPLGLDPQ